MIRDPSGQRVLGVGTVTRDITERKRVEEEQRFLAEAGAVLASSLDYEQTLSTLGQLMVRDFADWCIVDIVEDDDRPRRLKVISARASQASLAARAGAAAARSASTPPRRAGPGYATRSWSNG